MVVLPSHFGKGRSNVILTPAPLHDFGNVLRFIIPCPERSRLEVFS